MTSPHIVVHPFPTETNIIVRPENLLAPKNRLIFFLCQAQLCSTILLSRFAFPFGDKQIQGSLVAGTICFAAIAIATRGEINVRRLLAFTTTVTALILETGFIHSSFSLLSLGYLAATYAPLLLAAPTLKKGDVQRIWATFIAVCTGIAVLGLIQVGTQILRPSLFLDPIQDVPQAFQLSGYNATYPILRGTIDMLKPNGMLLLEPSFFSQFVALALLGEVTYFRRWTRIAILTAALIASFSGTGLLIALCAILFTARKTLLLAGAIVLIFSGVIFSSPALSSFFGSRLQEFSHPGTSGNARIAAPYQETLKIWHESSISFLFGIGAGNSSHIDVDEEVNFPPLTKVGVEFGLAGLLIFSCLWVSMFSRLAVHRTIKVGLLVFYFVASGALLHPPTVFPLWGLTLGFQRASENEPD